MVEVKFTHVVQCSSEDMAHPATNLLCGAGNGDYWLCAQHETSIEVELQLEKETLISFLDIGNHGSQSVDILVSHSSRSRREFVSLVPTFNFMTVQESKQGINKTKVQMFQGADMMSESKLQSWDRLKLVCRQPYSDKKYGLNFVSLKIGSEEKCKTTKMESNNNQSRLIEVFDSLRNDSSPLRKPKLSPWSTSPFPTMSQLKCATNVKSTVVTPIMKSPVTPTQNALKDASSSSERKRPLLSGAAVAQFKDEVGCFLEDVNFRDLMQSKNVKVSDLRCQIELQRGLALIKQQKLIFMEIITEKLKEVKQSAVSEEIPMTNDRSVGGKVEDDAVCTKCLTKVPKRVLTIHSNMCKPATPKRIQKPGNRNRLCFDLGDSSDDEVETNPRKRSKINISGSVSEIPFESNITTIPLLTVTTPLPSQSKKMKSPAMQQVGRSNLPATPIQSVTKATKNVNEHSTRRETLQTVGEVCISEGSNAECPICFKQIACHKIAMHASLCNGSNDDSGDEDLPEITFNKSVSEALSLTHIPHTAKLTRDEVQCPICEKFMSEQTIEVHANVCLDMSA